MNGINTIEPFDIPEFSGDGIRDALQVVYRNTTDACMMNTTSG